MLAARGGKPILHLKFTPGSGKPDFPFSRDAGSAGGCAVLQRHPRGGLRGEVLQGWQLARRAGRDSRCSAERDCPRRTALQSSLLNI